MTTNETKEPNPEWENAPFEEHRWELINGRMEYWINTEPPPIPKDFNLKNYWNGESK